MKLLRREVGFDPHPHGVGLESAPGTGDIAVVFLDVDGPAEVRAGDEVEGFGVAGFAELRGGGQDAVEGHEVVVGSGAASVGVVGGLGSVAGAKFVEEFGEGVCGRFGGGG